MPKLTPEEDLTENWCAFCSCDPFYGREDFPERMEAAGLIYLDDVDDDDLDQAFASELGIEPGGKVWRLTDEGRRAMEREASRVVASINK